MPDGYLKIYEVCIAMVTAILGLAYPIFVDKINGIADKYNSSRMSDKFRKETSYRSFNTLIFLCVIELFVFPVLMVVYDTRPCHQLLIMVQGFCVFTLSILIIRLCHLLMTYSDPFRFLKRILTNDSYEEILVGLEVLMLYSSKVDADSRLFNETENEFILRILKYQKKRCDEYNRCNEEENKDSFFMYSSTIYHVLEHIMYSSAEPQYVVLNKNTDIVDVLYNTSNDYPITEQVYNLLWGCIKEMAIANQVDWLKQYWSIATRYDCYQFDLSSQWKEGKRFREFQLMVCVLLLYYKQYEVLQHALTFTTILPPQYPLIPSSFKCVFDYCANFLTDKEPCFLSMNYNVYENLMGASADYKIEGLLLDYLALLLVRLCCLNNFSNGNTPDIPQTAKTIEENEYFTERITALNLHLENISDVTIEVLGMEIEAKQKAKDLLVEFGNKCNGKIQYLKERRTISDEKQKDIKWNLISSVKKEKIFLPTINNSNKEDGDISYLATIHEPLSDKMILDSYYYHYNLMDDKMIPKLHVKFYEFYYSKIISGNVTNTTYNIRCIFPDIEVILNRLCLSYKYAILAYNVPLSLYYKVRGFIVDNNNDIRFGESNVYRITVLSKSMPSFFVMKEEDVPCVKYRPLDEIEYTNGEEEEIEPSKHLYSNIDNLKENELILTLKQGYFMHMTNTIHFVRLLIVNSTDSNVTAPSEVKPIKELLG